MFRELEFIRDLPDATFVIDHKGTVLAWNRMMEELTGIPSSDMVGKANYEYAVPFYGRHGPILIDIALNPDTDVPGRYQGLSWEGRVVTATTTTARPLGKEVVLWVRASPITDYDGTIVGAIETIRDITGRKLEEDRLSRINECLLNLGADHENNIWAITALCGELLRADTALYARLEGDMICTAGQWQVPDGIKAKSSAGGNICFGAIRSSADTPLVVRNLQDSPYAETDPNVAAFGLRTYVGHAVRAAGTDIGSLCVVYTRDLEPTPGDLRIMGILSAAIAQEEERSRAERQLRASEERYRLLADKMTDIVWTMDLSLKTTYVSPSVKKILGFTIRERLAQDIREQVTPASYDKLLERFNAEMELEKREDADPDRTATMELDFYRKDGSSVCLESVISAIRDRNGSVVALHGVSRDITDRKRSDEILRESEEKYRALVEHGLDPVMICDFTGRALFVNHAVISLLKAENADDLVGRNVLEFVAPESQEEVISDFSNVIQGNDAYLAVYRILDLQGNMIWVETIGKRIQYEGKPADLVSFRDITERKKVEEALRVAQEKYTKAFLSAPDAITISDLESGRFIEVNDAASRIFGYTRDELIGKSSLELGIWPDKEVRDAMVDRIRAQGRIAQYEVVERRKSGELFNASVTADTMYIGNARYLIATTRDITDHKRVEDELMESRARYSSLFDNNYSVSLLIDPDTGRIVDANAAATRYYRYTHEQLTKMGIFDLNRLDKKTVIKNLVRAKNEQAKHFFSTHYLAGGEKRNVEIYSGPITVHGKPLFYSIIHDITDRKKAEEARRQASERLSLATHAGGVGIWELDLINNILIWDDQMFHLYGIAPDTFSGTYEAWRAEVHPDDLAQSEAELQMALRGEKEFDTEFRVVWPDGTIHYIHASAHVHRDASGKSISLIGTNYDITDRRRTEDALRESEARYSSLFDNSYSISLLIDPDTGRIVDANDAAARYYGYSVDRLMQMGIYDLNRLDKKTVIKNLIRAKNEQAKHFFSTHYLAGGEKRNVEIYSGPITVKGKPLFYSIIHDITDRVLAEKALRENEAQLEAILQGSPIPKFVIDRNHRIIYWNKALEELSGIKASEMIRTNLHWRAFYRKERPCIADLLVDGAIDRIAEWYEGKYGESALLQGTFEATDYFPDLGTGGKWLRITGTRIQDERGRVIGAVETLEDMTARVEAERALRESEEKYRTLIDQIPDIVLIHRKGILLYVNPAAADQLGYGREALIGTSITGFIDPKYHEAVLSAMRQREGGVQIPPYEIVIRAHDGTRRTVLVNGATIRYEGAPASLNVLTDITKIKLAEEIIRKVNEELERRVLERTDALSRANVQLAEEIKARNEAEKTITQSLDEKEVLLREIHHRVKNNLQIIASLLNLQSRYIRDEKVLEAIRDSQNRVRAMALVHERIYRSHSIATINLGDYLRYLINQLFRFYNVSHEQVNLSFSMEETLSDIDTAIPCGLIMNELVSNSLKHAFPDGRKGEIAIDGSHPSPDQIRFIYRDNGVGFPADFDWRNSTSLGLRLVNNLTEQLKGTVVMEQDNGTVFTITVRPKSPVKKGHGGK